MHTALYLPRYLISVEVNQVLGCTGFVAPRVYRSLGLPPMAHSIGLYCRGRSVTGKSDWIILMCRVDLLAEPPCSSPDDACCLHHGYEPNTVRQMNNIYLYVSKLSCSFETYVYLRTHPHRLQKKTTIICDSRYRPSHTFDTNRSNHHNPCRTV